MRKSFWALLPLLMLIFGLMTPALSPVLAIEEITPTPSPEEEVTPAAFNSDTLIDEAIQDLNDGNWRAAISKMDEVLAVETDNVQAYLIRGVAYSRLGRLSLAVDDLTAAIEIAPYNSELYIFRGDVYSQLGDNTGALLDYDQSIAVNWLNEIAFSRRAELFFQLGDTEAGNVDDLISRALSAYRFGDNTTARDFLLEAIDAGGDLPSVAQAYVVLGMVFISTEDYREAIDAFTSAEAINPFLHILYLGRGIAYRLNDNILGAGQDFAERMELLGEEFIDEEASIGDTLEVDMAYRRVYRITFEGELGQVVTLTARDATELRTDPLIALLGPDGEPIAGDDDFGGNFDSQIADFELPANGTYTLLVSHAEGGAGIGFEGVVEVSIE